MENQVALKHTESEIMIAFETHEENALSLIKDNVNAIESTDELYTFIGRSALAGRAQWVQTALVCAKAFDGKTRKEVSALHKEFAEKLRYSEQSIHNYRQAGAKLLSGEFDHITDTMREFLARPSTQKTEYYSIETRRKAGQYKDNNGKTWFIFLGYFDDGNDSKSPKNQVKYFIVSEEQAIFGENDIINIVDMTKQLKNGKEVKESHYFFDKKDLTSLKVVSL